MTETLITAFLAALSAGILTFIYMRSSNRNRILHKVNEASQQQAALQSELQSARMDNSRLAAELAAQKSLTEQIRQNYEKIISSMKEDVVKNMQAETERLLKQREEELAKGNRNTMDDILKPLKTSIEDMQKAMQENKESHLKKTTELSEQLKQAVREMREETSNVGKKADVLSEALTGRPKVQGCFGENFLEAILAQEGLVKGLHYTREEVNKSGTRPDFVFHFKEGLEEKDLIVDSKVSLTSFVNYMNATDEEQKKIYLAAHVKSVRSHIDELAGKEYHKQDANSFADYVLMFMPRDLAFRVAQDADPTIWQYAYEKNVLITTEQTIVPFLKIMQLTWTKFEHDSNIQDITAAASDMIERVGLFYDSYIDMGKRLKGLTECYNSGLVKLKDNGKSITTSARKVMMHGAKRRKGAALTIPEDPVQITPDEED